MKLELAEVLFIHSIPSPNSDNSTCCFGKRKTVLSPVPIMRISNDSLAKRGNKNSLLISSILVIESSSV